MTARHFLPVPENATPVRRPCQEPMSIFRMKSLAAKLILITGAAIALVLLVSNFFLIGQTRDRVHALTMDQANLEAKSIANEIAANVGELASAARSMSGVLGRGHEGKTFDRKGIINILKANLEQNAFAFGSWFCEQLGAFDGKTAEIADKLDEGTNKNGAFTPYCRRRGMAPSSFRPSTTTIPPNGGNLPPTPARAPSPHPILPKAPTFRRC
ncbi:hypothetical protein AJ87_04455 [Rhizobium yanglingense]|nr:hypothetical protein AJ87_04455 [Rhizobium yanglingense]